VCVRCVSDVLCNSKKKICCLFYEYVSLFNGVVALILLCLLATSCGDELTENSDTIEMVASCITGYCDISVVW
jgi:hypothetical protein